MPGSDDSLDGLIRAVAEAPPVPLTKLAGERFQLLHRLSEGTFGVVYEAEDLRDRRRVALKMLRDPRAEWIRRFKGEFRALQDLRHRNLVAFEELFCVGERWFLTMELLRGTDIIEYTRATSPGGAGRGGATGTAPRFDEARVRRALAQLMDGLAAFHATGRVHRDIKPSNVLVTAEERVVLLDFGLATEASTRDASAIVGTPAYMAPEQAAGRAVGVAADQYAAGVLLYEMLAGDLPHAQTLPAHTSSTRDLTEQGAAAHAVAPWQRTLPPDCPADLAEICLALLSPDPAARPDAAALATRLKPDAPALASSSSQPALPRTLIVGRTAELATLSAALAEVERGGLVSVVVHGESGIGKSSLVRGFLDELRGSDQHVVLAGRCYEKESVPFKAFDEIVDALSGHLVQQPKLEVAGLVPRHAAHLRTLFPVLGRVPGFDRARRTGDEQIDPHELRHRAFAALREMFVRLGEQHTVLVHIDDFQWADQDSLLLLTTLLGPPEPPRMLLVATTRQEVDFAAMGIGGAARALRIGPLDRRDAALLAQQLTAQLADSGAPALDEPQLERLTAEAHGHPYFLIELVRHVRRAAGDPGARLDLDEAIWERASLEPAGAQRLLKYVCVAGVPIAPALLQVLCAEAPAAFHDHCDALTREHLVRSTDSLLVPYHDRVREAIVKRLAEDELRRLHADLARAFADHPDLALLVRHLEASGQLHEASQKAVAAARRARAGLAFEQAVTLYRTSLRLDTEAAARDRTEASTKHRINRAQLLHELADILAAMGKALEASEVYARAADGAPAKRRLECHIQVAHQLLIGGHLRQGILKMRELFAEQALGYPATPTYALLRIAGHRIALSLVNLRALPRGRRQAEPRDRAQLALYKAAIQGLVLVDPIRAAFCVGGALRLTREIGDHEGFRYFLLLEGDLRMSETARQGAGAGVVAAFDELYHPAELPQAIVTVHKGARTYMHMRGDDVDALERLLKADEELATTRIAPWELAGGRTFLLLLLRRLGRYSELRRRYTSWISDARSRNDVYTEATTRGFGNLLHLIDYAPERAREELASSMWTSVEDGFHVQHWYDFNALMEAHLYEGRAPDAAYIAGQLAAFGSSRLGRLAVFAAETEWLVGRLALAFPALAARLPFGRGRIRKAIRRLERTGAPYPALLATALRAGLAHTTGDLAAARAELHRAVQLGKGLDMQVHPAAATYQLGRLEEGRDGAATCARAAATLTAEGVRDVGRFVDLLLPGFAAARPRLPDAGPGEGAPAAGAA
jgi:serine/threonine protein kinase